MTNGYGDYPYGDPDEDTVEIVDAEIVPWEEHLPAPVEPRRWGNSRKRRRVIHHAVYVVDEDDQDEYRYGYSPDGRGQGSWESEHYDTERRAEDFYPEDEDFSKKEKEGSKKALIAVGASAAAIIAASSILVFSGSDEGDTSALPTESSFTSETKSPENPPPPVGVRPQHFMLDTVDMGEALATMSDPSPVFSSKGVTEGLVGDVVTPAICHSVWTPASSAVFASTPFVHSRTEMMGSSDTSWVSPHVIESAFTFSTPEEAGAVRTRIADEWAACSREPTFSAVDLPPNMVTFTLRPSPTEDRDEIVSIRWSDEGSSWGCQRASASQRASLIDVRVCGVGVTDEARTVVQKMLDKTPQ